MKLSLNWAQLYSNVDLKTIPIDELVEKIGSQLGAVEEVVEWGPRFNKIVVAKVVTCDPHPNADKLKICRIDDGKVTEKVERGEDGLIQVVCGAPNAKAGLIVAWLPPGSTVPNTIDKDPFVLEAREIRGTVSNGMLASPSELGISDNHDGILEIDPEEVGAELTKPGTPFKKLYGLDDVVIDIENKMFTHRPDCFGIIGIARELAGITHKKFVSPDWYLQEPVFKAGHDSQVKIEVTTDLVPRFMAVVMQNITVAPSPMTMQTGLTRVGIRPINNMVDITNWLMHTTGQPLHAYDYDKVLARSGGTATLQARLAANGEKVALLNGKTVELDDKTVVISTDKEIVGIGGVMGGADTEVDENTKNIILEAATFDMYSVRKTAMKYGLFTDAVTRYTKGQSPLQNDRVIAEAIRLVNQYGKGHQASDVMDHKSDSVQEMPVVTASAEFINVRLGSSMTVTDMQKLLENVECSNTSGGAQESRSYLMGVGDIDDKLTRIGVKIIEKSVKGHYKLVIPIGREADYEKLVSWEMKPGFWNEYIGVKNVFLFKDPDTHVSRYEVSDDNEHEIVEMCRTYANEFYTSVEAMLALNDWYRPLLPLHKPQVSDTVDDENAVIVSPPFWRRDLELPEDLVEEVGRLFGFDKLPVKLPQRPAVPSQKNPEIDVADRVRSILASGGANEVLTYSFVNRKLLESSGQDAEQAFHIRNAISPDLQHYRLSLTPSLLDKVHMNIKAGINRFALFEVGLTHSKKDVDEDGLPVEAKMLALTLAIRQPTKDVGTAYYRAVTYLDFMAAKLGLSFEYKPIDKALDAPVAAPFEISRSALVYISGTKVIAGIVGEYRSTVRAALKLPAYSAGFEIGLRELQANLPSTKKYVALSRFPKSQQDITFDVDGSVLYGALKEALLKAASLQNKEHGYEFSLKPGDIFVPDESDRKRITFHATLGHPDRTLTTDEFNKFLEELAKQAAADCAAKRI